MTRIIGVDCATEPRNVGLALAERGSAEASLVAVERGSSSTSLARRIAEWMGDGRDVLLALDAPLGWPSALGDALYGHGAGGAISEAPDRLFRRLTDRVVHDRVGKLPLEVGADRIARTAVAALARPACRVRRRVVPPRERRGASGLIAQSF